MERFAKLSKEVPISLYRLVSTSTQSVRSCKSSERSSHAIYQLVTCLLATPVIAVRNIKKLEDKNFQI